MELRGVTFGSSNNIQENVNRKETTKENFKGKGILPQASELSSEHPRLFEKKICLNEDVDVYAVDYKAREIKVQDFISKMTGPG